MKLFKRKLSVIKEETPVEKIRLEDGELEAVSGGVVEGQTLVCEDCLKPYTFTRGNFSKDLRLRQIKLLQTKAINIILRC